MSLDADAAAKRDKHEGGQAVDRV